MNSTKIFKILSSNSVVVNNRFIKYVKSPYHNANESAISLTDILSKAIKNNDALSREEVYLQVFSSSIYDDKKLRKLTSLLVDLYQDFLVQEKLSTDPLLKYELLLQSIQKDQVDMLKDKAKQNALRYFQREPERSGDYYIHKYSIEKSIYYLQSEYEKKLVKKGAKRNLGLEDLNSDLDQFYIIEKLRLACDLIAWQRIYKIKERPFEVEIILRMLNRGELLKNPVLSAYVHTYNMLIDRDATDHYRDLKILIQDQIAVFPKEELREIYDALLTYNIGQLKIDSDFHLNEILSIYDFAINNEIITENGVISPTTFRNYVVAGLRANQFDMVEQFINNRAKLLKQEHRENAVNFCMARLYWYKKEWNNVIQQLAIVEFKDAFYNLDAKMMLATSYYELNELDTLEYLLDAFYTSLYRNKDLSEKKIVAYKPFIAFTKKLVKLRDRDTKGLINLKDQITQVKGIHGKGWLLEKINQKLN